MVVATSSPNLSRKETTMLDSLNITPLHSAPETASPGTITVTFPRHGRGVTIGTFPIERRPLRKRRPAAVVALGRTLHPEVVADAWYAAGCPPKLDARAAGIKPSVRLRWRIASLLRGC